LGGQRFSQPPQALIDPYRHSKSLPRRQCEGRQAYAATRLSGL
jgi:hypothetical protein